MRLVETPLRQKQLSKGRKTWKCEGSRGEGGHALGQARRRTQANGVGVGIRPKQERERTVREEKSPARKPKGKRRVVITY